MTGSHGSKRRPGRPLSSSDSRQKTLIRSARRLFLSKPYSRVTIREIASSAGVDSSLITYYFANKQQLYEAMISECFKEPLFRLNQMKKEPLPSSITELFGLVYQVYGKHPDLSLLILRTLVLGDGPCRSFLIRDIVIQLRRYVIAVFDSLQQQGVIDESLDSALLEDAFAGLCLRPFQMRQVWISNMGKEETDLYIQRLLKQNAQLFERAVSRR